MRQEKKHAPPGTAREKGINSVKYRLYIDEVGNSDFGASQDPNHRYLSLTGVIMELDYVAKAVTPRFEQLKARYFDAHPDEPVVLHRKEMLSAKPPFHALRDQKRRKAFDGELLNMLKDLEYQVITVVIDKLEQRQRYTVWRFDPYHYALTILVERYVKWLERLEAKGDVMAESRGGKEDRRLKASFSRLYTEGSDYIAPEVFSQWLTSGELKVRPKTANVTGLQLADLIAHPSFQRTRSMREPEVVLGPFGAEIVQILEEFKYLRDAHGRIDGWGRKWLP